MIRGCPFGEWVQLFNASTARDSALFADAMFEFPNAQGGKKQGFSPRQGAGCGHGMFAIVTVGAIARASALFAGGGFGFSDGPGGGAGDV